MAIRAGRDCRGWRARWDCRRAQISKRPCFASRAKGGCCEDSSPVQLHQLRAGSPSNGATAGCWRAFIGSRSARCARRFSLSHELNSCAGCCAGNTLPQGRRCCERGVLEVIRQLQGFEAPASAWEPQILARRVAGYDPQNARSALPDGRGGLGTIVTASGDPGARRRLYRTTHWNLSKACHPERSEESRSVTSKATSFPRKRESNPSNGMERRAARRQVPVPGHGRPGGRCHDDHSRRHDRGSTQSSVSIEQLLGKFIFGNLALEARRDGGAAPAGAEMSFSPPPRWPAADGTVSPAAKKCACWRRTTPSSRKLCRTYSRTPY